MSVTCIDAHPRFKAANHNAGVFPVPTRKERLRQLRMLMDNIQQDIYSAQREREAFVEQIKEYRSKADAMCSNLKCLEDTKRLMQQEYEDLQNDWKFRP